MYTVDFTFRDNNGKKAQLRVRPGAQSSADAAASWALAAASVFQQASSARLESFKVWKDYTRPDATTPEPTSNVRRLGVLFYRNADDCYSISLPSVREVLAEAVGAFAGLRITRDSLDLLGLLVLVDSLPTGLHDDAGRAYAGDFSVGAITGT